MNFDRGGAMTPDVPTHPGDEMGAADELEERQRRRRRLDVDPRALMGTRRRNEAPRFADRRQTLHAGDRPEEVDQCADIVRTKIEARPPPRLREEFRIRMPIPHTRAEDEGRPGDDAADRAVVDQLARFASSRAE